MSEIRSNVYREMFERFDDEWQANEIAEAVVEEIRNGEPYWYHDGYIVDEWGNEIEEELVEW